MTAPDPGLTDLIAAHTVVETERRYIYPPLNSHEPFRATGHFYIVTCSCGWKDDSHPAHVALVVEQHNQGQTARIAELEATIARVENALPEASTGFNPTLSEYDKGWERGQQGVVQYVRSAIAGDARAALEGERR